MRKLSKVIAMLDAIALHDAKNPAENAS